MRIIFIVRRVMSDNFGPKHLLVLTSFLGFCFMLIFSCFSFNLANATQIAGKDVGTTAIILIFLAQMISSIFLPTLLISRVPLRFIFALSGLLYSILALALFSENEIIIYISSVLLGTSAGILWVAHGTLIYQIDQLKKVDLGLINSSFWLIFSFAGLVGHTLSYICLFHLGTLRDSSYVLFGLSLFASLMLIMVPKVSKSTPSQGLVEFKQIWLILKERSVLPVMFMVGTRGILMNHISMELVSLINDKKTKGIFLIIYSCPQILWSLLWGPFADKKYGLIILTILSILFATIYFALLAFIINDPNETLLYTAAIPLSLCESGASCLNNYLLPRYSPKNLVQQMYTASTIFFCSSAILYGIAVRFKLTNYLPFVCYSLFMIAMVLVLRELLVNPPVRSNK